MSYYNLHMEFQRRQPTFSSLRLVMRRLREEKRHRGEENVEPTLEELLKQYPMSSLCL